MYVSHVADDGRQEAVADHLREVAEMAADFARPFGANDWAYAAGMLHDIGKYSCEFQKRILHNGPRVDHSTAGAYQLWDSLDAKLLAYCVAGHHGGLPDGGSPVDTEDDATIQGRIKRAAADSIPDYSSFASEIGLPDVGGFSFRGKGEPDGFALSFLTRMIFSCLVDADFLCTERFMEGTGRQSLSMNSLDMLLERLESHIESFFPPANELNRVRCVLLDACARVAVESPGVFSLTVPTGGGKTFASLRFALRHALANGHAMRRVIYALPYTSIIEQNAAVFREVLGEENVLEHHANFDFDFDEEQTQGTERKLGEALRLATENWDAPVVVTTNVQLFESLFSNKTSRCRKLHNIANSVIVLDEAQMIPTKQLEPCIRALVELVHHYGCTVVLCTATQPSFESLFGASGCVVREIAPDLEDLYKTLRRVTYRYSGEIDDESLAEKLADHDQVLCVVNSRKQARHLYDLMRPLEHEAIIENESVLWGDTDIQPNRGELSHREKMTLHVDKESNTGVFHLSTLMHAVHREEILKEIRRRLDDGEPCRVVATSLIEAGVDVDFPVVFRALAGVDSIVQCAGRCNREGRASADESLVHVFRPAESYRLPSEIDQRAALTWSVLLQTREDQMDGNNSQEQGFAFDFGALDVISSYFEQLQKLRRDNLDAGRVCRDLMTFATAGRIPSIPFKAAAERFRMIEEGSHPVIVPDQAIQKDLEEVRSGHPTRKRMRRISRFTVGLYDQDINALRSAHAIRLFDDDTYELIDSSLYDAETGLDASDAGGKGLFL